MNEVPWTKLASSLINAVDTTCCTRSASRRQTRHRLMRAVAQVAQASCLAALGGRAAAQAGQARRVYYLSMGS